MREREKERERDIDKCRATSHAMIGASKLLFATEKRLKISGDRMRSLKVGGRGEVGEEGGGGIEMKE